MGTGSAKRGPLTAGPAPLKLIRPRVIAFRSSPACRVPCSERLSSAGIAGHSAGCFVPDYFVRDWSAGASFGRVGLLRVRLTCVDVRIVLIGLVQILHRIPSSIVRCARAAEEPSARANSAHQGFDALNNSMNANRNHGESARQLLQAPIARAIASRPRKRRARW